MQSSYFIRFIVRPRNSNCPPAGLSYKIFRDKSLSIAPQKQYNKLTYIIRGVENVVSGHDHILCIVEIHPKKF
jgi:hypothetical protein